MCRQFSDVKAGVTYMYVPLSVLSEERAQELRVESGFTFFRKLHAEIWSIRYVLYLTRVGRFAPGEKAALAAAINHNAHPRVIKVSFNADFGNNHFGTVTISAPERVSGVTNFVFLNFLD